MADLSSLGLTSDDSAMLASMGLSDADQQAFANAADPGSDLAGFSATAGGPSGLALTVGGPNMGTTSAKALFRRGVAMVGASVRSFPAALLPSAIQAIATLVGAAPGDLVTGFLKKKSKGRRTRGISGRQLHIARGVIGKVERMHRQLAHAFGHGYRARSSYSPPFRAMKRK